MKYLNTDNLIFFPILIPIFGIIIITIILFPYVTRNYDHFSQKGRVDLQYIYLLNPLDKPSACKFLRKTIINTIGEGGGYIEAEKFLLNSKMKYSHEGIFKKTLEKYRAYHYSHLAYNVIWPAKWKVFLYTDQNDFKIGCQLYIETV
mgnify:CR=1 FL=1